jgi:hypothetical protein
VVDDRGTETDSDLRRRAAWLLGMLAVVAVLFVLVMTQVLGSGDKKSGDNGPGALDSAVAAQTDSPSSGSGSTRASSPARTAPTSKAAGSSSATRGRTTCPGRQTCILDGDVGNGIDAINAYRTEHGQPAVPGRVSTQAQKCAVRNGNGCSGGWAETEVAKPNGRLAVQKILEFGRLLDPNVKTFEVGWAYDPGAKLYYFAIIRND